MQIEIAERYLFFRFCFWEGDEACIIFDNDIILHGVITKQGSEEFYFLQRRGGESVLMCRVNDRLKMGGS